MSTVLLTMGSHFGTISAVRAFGRASIPIVLADANRLAPAAWSRYVHSRVSPPDAMDFAGFADFLMSYGRENPGTFLYPSCDNVAWIIASRQAELSKYFRLYQAPLSATASLLIKPRLQQLAQAVGLETPETWWPQSPEEARQIAHETGFDLLIKPPTQIGLFGMSKGEMLDKRRDVGAQLKTFAARNGYHEEILAFEPRVAWPLLQRWYKEAADDIYSVAGFIDETGQRFFVRASRKVFQKPRRLGIGLSFEHEAVHAGIAEKIKALCLEAGYFGAFEVELIRIDGGRRYLLIDFNPRFYGQMGFEVARDLPLPLAVYEAARGHTDVPGLLPTARHEKYRYANSWQLALLILTQSLSGRLKRADRQRWRQWLRDPGYVQIDAIKDEHDRLPIFFDFLATARDALRHPRGFIRKYFLES